MALSSGELVKSYTFVFLPSTILQVCEFPRDTFDTDPHSKLLVLDIAISIEQSLFTCCLTGHLMLVSE